MGQASLKRAILIVSYFPAANHLIKLKGVYHFSKCYIRSFECLTEHALSRDFRELFQDLVSSLSPKVYEKKN
jgi:hypothetical protein